MWLFLIIKMISNNLYPSHKLSQNLLRPAAFLCIEPSRIGTVQLWQSSAVGLLTLTHSSFLLFYNNRLVVSSLVDHLRGYHCT